MDIFLQSWGGLFYLSNKIFFALAEASGHQRKRHLKLIGWTVYLLGVPAWVIILLSKHDWIAASLELGAIPSMLLGWYCVYRQLIKPPRLFDRFAATSTYFFLLLGLGYSLFDFGGIRSLSQLLELAAAGGFLIGSYQLAGNRLSGWLFFIVMNASMGALMLLHGKHILAIQQCVSLCFVIAGFTVALRKQQRHRKKSLRVLPQEEMS